jgi:hypothetical protein
MTSQQLRGQHEGGGLADDSPQRSTPGRATLTGRHVARPSDAQREVEDAVIGEAWAAHGVRGAGEPLPHRDAVQRAFGDHDLGAVVAHVGGDARQACDALDAHGYAVGDHVAFAEAPSLHLVAHEAAHVVQQRAGVHLSSTQGGAGDAYEQHADAVADRVVRGESAAPLLPPPGGAATGAAVQRSARNRHDHRERWGGVAEDLPGRIIRIDENDGDGDDSTTRTRIVIGRGLRDQVHEGMEGYIVSGATALCRFTVHRVTDTRAHAFVPLAIQYVRGHEDVVLGPTRPIGAPALQRATDARITRIETESHHFKLTVGLGEEHGVRVGMRGHLRLDGKNIHDFTVTERSERPNRSVIRVRRAGTHETERGITLDMVGASTVVFTP